MRSLRASWLGFCLSVSLGLMATVAEAHFLFVRISPLGEGGRRAEVFFSEKAEAGDPRYISKLAGTKLWIQTRPGEFSELPVRSASDRLISPLPSSGSAAVVGVCDYGIRSAPKKIPFLLRYYPKAVAGTPTDANLFKPRSEIPFEINARFSDDTVVFTVLADGKPQPGAKLITVDRNLSNETLVTDASGQVAWKPARGEYSVYTDRTLKTPGTRDGATYDEIREFTTIAFRFPLDREAPDAEAVESFQKAIAARAQWRNFPGFDAKISGSIDGRDFSGTVRVPADGQAKLTLDDAAHANWVADQLGSIVMHRRAESNSDNKERPVLRFADEDDAHPLGRLLEFEGGRFASSYRILDGRITTVNRDIGTAALTILTLENIQNAEGKDLPKSYLVQTWDARSGLLTKAETVRDTWKRVGSYDLPVTHVVTSSNQNGMTVRQFELSDIRLLDTK